MRTGHVSNCEQFVVTVRDLCHFDKLAATPLLTSPCQPDPIRALESNPTEGTFQLLLGGNLDNVGDGLQHKRVACVDDPSASDLQGEVESGVTPLPQVACQPLVLARQAQKNHN